MAVYCSNSQLILRYVGHGRFPIVRQIPWFKDASKRISSMDFNPTAEWIVAICVDFSVYIIPVFAVMTHAQYLAQQAVSGDQQKQRDSSNFSPSPSHPQIVEKNQTDWFGRLPSLMNYALETPAIQDGSIDAELGPSDDLTLVLAGTRTSRYGTAVHCIWWRTMNSLNIAITATQNGYIIFVNLGQRVEVGNVKLKVHIFVFLLFSFFSFFFFPSKPFFFFYSTVWNYKNGIS